MIELEWHDCYKKRWGSEASPESHAHPAKFSRNLIRQIYTYLLDEGLLKAGDTVLDPFGGVALGAADALQNGINFVGIELEQKFVDFGGCHCTGISQQDWLHCYGRWERFNHKNGRHWCPLCLAEAKEIIDASPQLSLFAQQKPSASYVRNSGQIPFTLPHRYAGNIDRFSKNARGGATAVLLQGDSRKLLEVLVGYGGVEGVVSSPPYGCNEKHDYTSAVCDQKGQGSGSFLAAKETDFVDAVITSAPYVESLASDEPKKRGGLFRDPKRSGDKTLTATYGETEGQMGGMKAGQVDGVVSSPPYSGNRIGANGKANDFRRSYHRGTYGNNTDGQMGAINGDTFWSAARLIVAQCRLLLREGSPAVFVTKDFVKDGQRVPFSDQWIQLCEACGFELVTHARAWLVEEQGSQYNLDGDLVAKRVERKSFFRRLAERKGSPRIDWEDVLIFRAI
jgi:hypothetical protein